MIKAVLKLIIITILVVIAVKIGIKGFSMPNARAADLCFGTASFLFLLSMIVFIK
jgi:hypothetical protein